MCAADDCKAAVGPIPDVALCFVMARDHKWICLTNDKAIIPASGRRSHRPLASVRIARSDWVGELGAPFTLPAPRRLMSRPLINEF